MKNCRFKSTSLFAKYSTLFGMFPAGVFIVIVWGAAMIKLISMKLFQDLMPVSVLLLGPTYVVFAWGIKIYSMEARRFFISEEGLTLSDRGKNFYKWSEIYDVFILAYSVSENGSCFDSVICCYLKPWTMQDQEKLLKSYMFGVMNQSRFVIIDYDPAIVEEFARFYHRPILDWRERQTGRKESML